MNYRERFRVAPGSHVDLAAIDPDFKDDRKNKASAKDEIDADICKLRDLQYLLYANQRASLLVILQGMDASGKDGTIAHVFTGVNPQGARVHAFKVPSTEEAAHDFLWRAHVHAPAAGEIVIFNRSHYEEVLVVRVHGALREKDCRARFELINDFEKMLSASGTTVLKFMLHISADEQLRRFEKRLDDPRRHWKISDADYRERPFWNDYRAAYQDALRNTSTEQAPWFLIPANHKWFRNLAIAKIVVETLESLHLTLPPTSVDIEDIRRKYHAALKAT